MNYSRQVRTALRPWAAALLLAGAASAAECWMYTGTYTPGDTKGSGIFVFRFQPDKGKLEAAGLAAETPNPSFLIENPNHRVVYAVNENPSTTGTVDAFSIDGRTGKLAMVNSVSSGGVGPCHMALDHTFRWMAVANYASGTVAVLPVQSDGKLGEPVAVAQHKGSSTNPTRQAGPHAHGVAFSPDNRFLLVADLGTDKIYVYRFDGASGQLAANDPPAGQVAAGSGPRHLVFHPNGQMLYAINELASTVTVFRWVAATGTMEEFQTISTVPAEFKGANLAAEIAINSAGTRLYASNRGHESLAMFSIDPVSYMLTAMEFPPAAVAKPRHFAFDPDQSNLVVAGQDSNGVNIFQVYPRTGQIHPIAHGVKSVPNPACVLFVPMRPGDKAAQKRRIF